LRATASDECRAQCHRNHDRVRRPRDRAQGLLPASERVESAAAVSAAARASNHHG
jgi:hypothetical protein